MELNEMKERLEKELPAKRFHHTLAVSQTAVELARLYGVDEEKAAIAGLLHDSGRQVPKKDFIARAAELGIELDEVEKNQPILIHAKLGVYYAQHEFGVTDPDILSSIRYHTTGAAHMSPLAMVIYLADLVEPNRDFPGVEELRSLAFSDIRGALKLGLEMTLAHLKEQGCEMSPASKRALDFLNQKG